MGKALDRDNRHFLLVHRQLTLLLNPFIFFKGEVVATSV